MITLSCPGCKNKITVDELCADQTARCPCCHETLTEDIELVGDAPESETDVVSISSADLAAVLDVEPKTEGVIASSARWRLLVTTFATLVFLGIVATVGMLLQDQKAGEGNDIIADQSTPMSEPRNAPEPINEVQPPQPPPETPARTPEKSLVSFEGHTGAVHSVAFTPDGRFVLSGGADKTLRIWDALTGKEVRRILRIAAPVHRVMCDGRTIFAAVLDQHVRSWDYETGDETGRCHVGRFGVLMADVSEDGGRMICSGGNGPDLWVWDTQRSKVVTRLMGHRYTITCVALSRDGRLALSGDSGDCRGTVRLWNLETERELFRMTSGDSVNAICFTPDGEQAAAVSDDGLLRVWDLNTGQLIRSFGDETKRPTCVAVSPNGRWALSGGRDRLLHLWDLASGTEHPHWIGGQGSTMTTVAFSPDGKRALSGSAGGTMHLWRVPEN